MAVKIRLKRLGKIRVPQYRIVVVDSRKKRDGRVIEEIGKYHPKEDPSYIDVVADRAEYWLGVGAQPTEAVEKILKITGDWQKFKGLPGAEGTLKVKEAKPSKLELFQAALERWWLPSLQLFGPPSKAHDPLLRWHIKSERNEDLRERYVQKFAPLLIGYGFELPDPVARYDAEADHWDLDPIDWTPLLATFENKGPDSARRLATASAAWHDTAWVREALEVAARDAHAA